MNKLKIPERFIWAAGLLKVKQTDDILEIGCGAGLFAEQIALQAGKGKLVAIDRSEAMIRKAIKRNEESVRNKRIHFLHGDFATITLPLSRFDIITAFNVSFFWKDAHEELIRVKNILRPGGRLYIFHQAPYEITIAAAEKLVQNLNKYSFVLIEKQIKRLVPASALCVIFNADIHHR